MRFLADEGFNGRFVRSLRQDGIKIQWVAEISPGISDREVIELAKSNNPLLLTEDKDFGEWVFAYKVKGLSILFVRYDPNEFPEILGSIKTFLRSFNRDEMTDENEFITLTTNKIRRRKI